MAGKLGSARAVVWAGAGVAWFEKCREWQDNKGKHGEQIA